MAYLRASEGEVLQSSPDAERQARLPGVWRSRLTQSFSVEGVAEDHPFVKDPAQRWDVGASEIVEPPDRKIPYQPAAARIGREGTNFREYIDPRTTCSTAGVPRLALQDPSQILQPPTDDHVLWLHEDHHQFRVIAMDQRPPVGREVTTWNGLSRGRWDGNTLVIETANFNGYIWIDDSGNFYTNNARVTERLTMVDPNTIHYEATIEDPTVYTRPWKVAWALMRDTTPGDTSYSKRRVAKATATCPSSAIWASSSISGVPGGNVATRHASESVDAPSFDDDRGSPEQQRRAGHSTCTGERQWEEGR